MEPNNTQEPEVSPDDKTTIQIRKITATNLTDCKHGNDTYDDVINRHMDHYKKNTGQ